MFYYNFNHGIDEGAYFMADDTSVIYKYSNKKDLLLDYSISLGGNPRFLMDIFHKTGKCGPLRCFMAGTKVVQKDLRVPISRKGELYFKSTEEMSQYSGTMYMTLKNICYYDEKNSVLCFGDPSQKGECLEFVENTYAVINRDDLVAIFMKVEGMKENIVINKGYMHPRPNGKIDIRGFL